MENNKVKKSKVIIISVVIVVTIISTVFKRNTNFGLMCRSILIYGHHIEQLTSDSRKYFEDRGYDILNSSYLDNFGEKIYFEYPELNVKKLESATGWQDWDKQLTKSLIWWCRVQNNDKYDYKIFSINALKNTINNGPQLINFYGEGSSAHAVVAQRLLQDFSNPNKYYLGIYDCNNPGEECYIEIKKKQLVKKNNQDILEFNTDIFDYDALDYSFDKKNSFYINDVRTLKSDLN